LNCGRAHSLFPFFLLLLAFPRAPQCLYTYWAEHRAEHVANGPWFDLMAFINFFSFTVSRLLNIYWMALIAQKVFCDGKKTKTRKVAPAGAAVKLD
jgi:hypothetical protein